MIRPNVANDIGSVQQQHCLAERGFSKEGVTNLQAILPPKKSTVPPRPDDLAHCI